MTDDFIDDYNHEIAAYQRAEELLPLFKDMTARDAMYHPIYVNAMRILGKIKQGGTDPSSP